MPRCWVRLLWCGILFSGWASALLAAATLTETAEVERWRRPIERFEKNSRPLDKQPEGLRYSELRIMLADDSRFADKGWDDSAWSVIGYQDLPARAGIYWVRFRARLEGSQLVLDDSFQVTAAASYRIFWDGQLIGSSGRPGANAQDEIVGALDGLYSLPNQARGPGEHVVALQMSAYGNPFPEGRVRLLCFSGPSAALETEMFRAAAMPVIGAAALLMLALTSWIIRFIGVRNAALSWFAAMCTFAALFQAVFTARFIAGYPYSWAYSMVMIRNLMMAAIGVSLVMFVAEQFAARVRYRLLAILIVIFVIEGIFSKINPQVMGSRWLVTGASVALILAIRSAIKHRTWSDGLIVGGVALAVFFLLDDPFAYSARDFFPKFMATELSLMAVLGVRVRNERRRMRDMQLHSARLEIELLKKNLQPHFLFNTLTAISEVISQSPEVAVALIDDLAEEFRALIRLSGEKLIPLMDELNLCETHLRIVGRRMGITTVLKVTGTKDGLSVPPAIFLTLIENAFTHQSVADSAGVFHLAIEPISNGVAFMFVSPGNRVANPQRREGGTGLRYLKARLEESFPDRWTFQHGERTGGWESRIVINH